jgi:hypothetical protein
MNENYEQQYNLSLFINIIRDFLKSQQFFEHHLYSTLNYKIENTDSFEVKENLYLRYNPEPDIWQVGIHHDKFFWIGSMFRNEKKVSDFHRYEFTVVDIYESQGSAESVIKRYIQILKKLEGQLKLPNVSDLEVRYMTHEEFAKTKDKLEGKYWLVVTGYPINESFYDTKGKDSGHTSKFEIFFINQGKSIEIAACGKLGENLNKDNYISEKENFINTELLKKNFIGFGIGIERLMYLYGIK